MFSKAWWLPRENIKNKDTCAIFSMIISLDHKRFFPSKFFSSELKLPYSKHLPWSSISLHEKASLRRGWTLSSLKVSGFPCKTKETNPCRVQCTNASSVQFTGAGGTVNSQVTSPYPLKNCMMRRTRAWASWTVSFHAATYLPCNFFHFKIFLWKMVWN